jgi:hypothetical protein
MSKPQQSTSGTPEDQIATLPSPSRSTPSATIFPSPGDCPVQAETPASSPGSRPPEQRPLRPVGSTPGDGAAAGPERDSRAPTAVVWSSGAFRTGRGRRPRLASWGRGRSCRHWRSRTGRCCCRRCRGHDDAIAVLDRTGNRCGAEVDGPVVVDHAVRSGGEVAYGQGTCRAGVAPGGQRGHDGTVGGKTLAGGEPEVAVGVVKDAGALLPRFGAEVDVLGVRQARGQAVGVEVDVGTQPVDHDLGVATSPGVVQRVQMCVQMHAGRLFRRRVSVGASQSAGQGQRGEQRDASSACARC